jgi:hypothetical protein
MLTVSRSIAIGSALLAGIALTNCVRVPDVDHAAKGPQVDEIVRRVKCDLYEAVADRMNAPYGNAWLNTWTVQANLNLIVNDQSQLSPGAVITQPLTMVSIPQKVSQAADRASAIKRSKPPPNLNVQSLRVAESVLV